MNDPLFGPKRIYDSDVQLLHRLGIDVANGMTVKHAEKTHLGRATRLSNGSPLIAQVDIYVEAWPACFYRIEMRGVGAQANKDVVMTTGSGKLSDYWPIAESYITGMFGINPL